MNQKRLNKIDGCLDILRAELDAEQEFYDSHSENWQESERGENSCEWIDAIQEAIDALEGVDRL